MSSSRQKSFLSVAPHARVGSGGPVTASFRQTTSGVSEVSITIDYSKASQPEFSYVADHCEVSPDLSGFTIAFGKMTSGRAALRTRIEVSFPAAMFQQQLIDSTIKFMEQMPKDLNIPIIEPRSFPDPEKIQTFRSNNVMVGSWGDEAVADFYYLSPADFGIASKTQVSDIRLIPVVRVTMSLALLKDFMTKCHEFDSVQRTTS